MAVRPLTDHENSLWFKLRLRSPFGLIVKRLGVTMLVSKQEARKTKLEHPDSIHESRYELRQRQTSFSISRYRPLYPYRWTKPIFSSNDFIEWIFDDPHCSPFQQLRDEFPHNFLRNHHLYGKPVALKEIGYRGSRDAWKDFHQALQVISGNVHLQPHHPFGPECPLEEERDLFDLFPLPLILIGFTIGDQLGIGLEQFFHDAEFIGTQGAAGLRHLHNSIAQSFDHLAFGGSPRKLHLDFNTPLSKIAPGEIDQFGEDFSSLQIFQGADRGVFGNHQDP